MDTPTITAADARMTADYARAAQTLAASRPASSEANASASVTNEPSPLSVFGDPARLHNSSPDELLNQFQNILLSEMLKAMRSSVMKVDLFGDNTARETFESLLDQEYVNMTGARGGALGLTEVLKRQLNLVDPPRPLSPDLLELPDLPPVEEPAGK